MAGRSEDVKLWYFIGFSKDGRVLHVDHDVLSSGEDGRDQARHLADNWFHCGRTIEGEYVEFSRVVAISEDHEVALDVNSFEEKE